MFVLLRDDSKLYEDFGDHPHLKENNESDRNINMDWNDVLSLKSFPNSLYLYGSVGCGKTMLLDILYDCAPMYVINVNNNSGNGNNNNNNNNNESDNNQNQGIRRGKIRLHFHEFMQEIHQTMHIWKKQGGINVTDDYKQHATVKIELNLQKQTNLKRLDNHKGTRFFFLTFFVFFLVFCFVILCVYVCVCVCSKIGCVAL